MTGDLGLAQPLFHYLIFVFDLVRKRVSKYHCKMVTLQKFRKVKKTKQCDRISDLDPNMLDLILMRLPTRDAARTSILSRRWRYHWTRVPKLVLDETLWQGSMVNQTSVRSKFTSIAFQILLLHQGPIRKFTLSMPALESCPEIDTLIGFLSRSGVEKLTLKMGENYVVPSALFSFPQLRSLNLHFCSINPPSTFKGFGQLVSLKLFNVIIADKALKSLISSCFLLEELQLELVGTIGHLEIVAPKLKLFLVGSIIKSILFRNTPALAMVSLALCNYETPASFGRARRDIIEHFGRLSNLETLHLDYYFVKSLAARGVPRRLATALINLKHFELSCISLDVMTEASFVLCLLRSSPNLQKIKISLFHEQIVDASLVYEFLEDQDYSDLNLNQLVKVKLEHVTGTENEMLFIQALLENLPNLETLRIEPDDDATNGRFEKSILKELLNFRRSSPNARIVYRSW